MGWDGLSLVQGSQQTVELWKCIPAVGAQSSSQPLSVPWVL